MDGEVWRTEDERCWMEDKIWRRMLGMDNGRRALRFRIENCGRRMLEDGRHCMEDAGRRTLDVGCWMEDGKMEDR